MKGRQDIFSDPKAFRQQVRLLAIQVSGLSPEELSTAIAYEVEPMSGIPAAEAEIGYRTVPDPDTSSRVYDVAVRRKRKGGGRTSSPKLLHLLLGLGILACLAAAADGAYLLWRRNAVRAHLTVQERLDAELKAVQARTRSFREAAEKLRSERASRAAAQETVAALRSRVHGLLGTVGTVCADKAVLVSADVTLKHADFRILAPSSQVAADVTARLAAEAAPAGWRVTPGLIEANGTRSSVTFTCGVDHD